MEKGALCPYRSAFKKDQHQLRQKHTGNCPLTGAGEMLIRVLEGKTE